MCCCKLGHWAGPRLSFSVNPNCQVNALSIVWLCGVALGHVCMCFVHISLFMSRYAKVISYIKVVTPSFSFSHPSSFTPLFFSLLFLSLSSLSLAFLLPLSFLFFFSFPPFCLFLSFLPPSSFSFFPFSSSPFSFFSFFLFPPS